MSIKQDWFTSWFSSPYYEILYHKRDETEARQFIDVLLNFLHPKEDASILDLACGTGRHAVYLASKGFEVTGIDLSQESIEQAAVFESDNLTFYVHDMRNEFRINYYDYTFNFFTSFGYSESEHDNYRALENVCKGLKNGGTFVIDFFNVDKVKANLVEEELKVIDGIEFKINRSIEQGRIIKDIAINDKGATAHFMESVQALSLRDFEKYLKDICLNVENVFGDYSLRPFDPLKSERLIIIAKKHA